MAEERRWDLIGLAVWLAIVAGIIAFGFAWAVYTALREVFHG